MQRLMILLFTLSACASVSRDSDVGKPAEPKPYSEDLDAEGAYTIPDTDEPEEHVVCEPVSVFFEFDSHELSQDALDTLHDTARCRRESPELVWVFGFADARGSREYNRILGERRAWNVVLALEKFGVSAPNFRWESYGEDEPLCHADEVPKDQVQACHSVNRRVDVLNF